MRIETIAALMALELTATPAGANGFKSIAKELASAARRGGIERVAVLPFSASQEGDSRQGWTVSERFVTQLVRTGKVQAVERSFLRKLLEEHDLGQTGVLAPESLKTLGRISSADGVVTGSLIAEGSRVIVNARLIDVQTGVIVAACEREFDADEVAVPQGRDGSELMSRRLFVPVPELSVPVPIIEPEDRLALRDGLNGGSCADAAARVDRYEEEILDVKARYWALRLKKGLDLSTLTRNPGSTISDPELKRRFYARLKEFYALEAIPDLTPSEISRFAALDQKAYSLHRDCGI